MPYLDHNASSPLLPEALDAMLPWLRDRHGNASSVHLAGQRARAAIDDARDLVATLLGCSPRDVVFTSGGTESDNLGLRGLARSRTGRTTIVTTAVEHPAVLDTVRALGLDGFEVKVIGVDAQGIPDLSAFDAALAPDTALVAAMWANNETGVLLPVHDLATRCRAVGIPLHVDAAQVAGRLPVDLSSLDAATVAFSAHKFGGPQGVGVLVVRGGKLAPTLTGGHQERGRRAGTENVASIVGLAAALESRTRRLEHTVPAVAARRDRLENGLRARIPGLALIGGGAGRLPNTSCVCVPGVLTEAMLMGLDLAGIQASGGSACTSGSLEPSHVLLAMGVPKELARGALRFSLSPETTDADVDAVVEVLPGLVERIRASRR